MKNILEFIGEQLFERFKGYRTQMVSVLLFLIGLIEFWNKYGAIFLCSRFKKFCDYESTELATGVMMALSVFMFLARKYSNTPAGPSAEFFKRFKKNYKDEVSKLIRKT